MLDLKELIEKFKQHTGVGFISFPYTNQKNETSRLLVNIGISYANAKKRDLDALNVGVEYIASEKYTKAAWDEAVIELIRSLINPETNRSEGQANAYIPITDNGSLKWNIEKRALYIVGSVVRKTVLEEGNYPEVKSSPKTIAKNTIKKNYLSTGQFRTYKVENLQGSIKINGDVIVVD